MKNELHHTTDPAKKELYSKLMEKHNLLQRYVAMINIANCVSLGLGHMLAIT